jgi:hypothetical protein
MRWLQQLKACQAYVCMQVHKVAAIDDAISANAAILIDLGGIYVKYLG